MPVSPWAATCWDVVSAPIFISERWCPVMHSDNCARWELTLLSPSICQKHNRTHSSMVASHDQKSGALHKEMKVWKPPKCSVHKHATSPSWHLQFPIFSLNFFIQKIQLISLSGLKLGRQVIKMCLAEPWLNTWGQKQNYKVLKVKIGNNIAKFPL